jgi:hypothetical protein
MLEGTAQLCLYRIVRYLFKLQVVIVDSVTLSVLFLMAVESFFRYSDLILSLCFVTYSTEITILFFFVAENNSSSIFTTVYLYFSCNVPINTVK